MRHVSILLCDKMWYKSYHMESRGVIHTATTSSMVDQAYSILPDRTVPHQLSMDPRDNLSDATQDRLTRVGCSILMQQQTACICHDDFIKWKHFPHYWPFVRGIHRSPVNSPHKCQWRRALMFSLICACINGWVNNGEAGDLRCHRTHYDVTEMLASCIKSRSSMYNNNYWLYSCIWQGCQCFDQ